MTGKTSKLKYIGKPLPLKSSETKVRGEALYAGDLEFPDMLEGAILRASHPHAKIVSIDTSKAAALPGVEAILTGADLPSIKYVHLPRYSDRYLLARDKVRFSGEGVAAVAATSREIARKALSLIEVRYKELRYAVDSDTALKKRFPEINLGPGGSFAKNLALRFNRDFGDVKGGNEQAAFILEGMYRSGVSAAVCLETSVTVARFDAKSTHLHLWTSSLTPSILCTEVAEVLGLDRKKIHIEPITVGGRASGKSHVGEHEAIAAYLAMQTKRPVRMNLTRHEEFMSSVSDLGAVMHVRHAVDGDGNILARSSSLTLDMGAYSAFAPAYLIAGRQLTACLYRVGAAHFDCRLAYTNKSSGGNRVGMGMPQLTWAIEDQMDQIADTLGKDRLQYRIEQASLRGDVTPLGWEIRGCEMAACLETVASRIGWRQARERSTPYRGIGIASMVHPSAGVLFGEGAESRASLELQPNGRFKLGTPIAETDTWRRTLLVQISAEVLGVPPGLIDSVHMPAQVSSDAGDLASQELYLASAAAAQAAKSFREKLRKSVAKRLGVSREEIFLDGRGVRSKTTAHIVLKFTEVFDQCGALRGNGSYASSSPHPDPYTGYGNFSPAHAFGAQAAEVEVDPMSGKVRVLRVIAAQDVGCLMNPSAFEACTREGIMEGIGIALKGEILYESGRPFTTSIAEHPVPRFEDVPEVSVVAVASESSASPFGIKSIGDGAVNATVAAIGNAIADAIGERLADLPFTPDRVLALIARLDTRGSASTKPWTRAKNLRDAAASLLYPKLVLPAKRKLFAKFPAAEPDLVEYDYALPHTLSEAIELLLKSETPVKIRAGGTELQPGINQGVYSPGLVVDISRLKELKHIELTNKYLRIGAGASLREVASHAQVNRLFPVLAEVIGQIANPQVRSVATIGGNLCQQKQCGYFRNRFPCHKTQAPGAPCFAIAGDNRQHSIFGKGACPSPCPSDMAPILDVLDAQLVIGSSVGQRRTSIQRFYRGPGEAKLDPDELVVAIEFPLSASSRRNAFEKFASFQSHFADASVAVSLHLFRGLITRASVSLGAVSPLPERACIAERMLVNAKPTQALIREAAEATVRGALPMSKNRHKVHLLLSLAEKALNQALWRG